MNLSREDVINVFRNPPTLETPRLELRRMLRRDADDMFEYSKDPEVTRYLLWEPHKDRLYTARYLGYIQSRYRSGDFYDWAVIYKESDKMIGTCGFTRFNFDANSAEIGYVLNKDYWGMKIAPEAVRRVIHFGFRDLGLHRIEARFMIGNDRSFAVMKKLGMVYEGTGRDSMYVKGRYVSVATCSMLRDEYFLMTGQQQGTDL